MKNTPNKIFLNTGTEEKDLDFNILSEVTWSKDRVFDSDLEFISSVFVLRRIEELEKEFDNTDSIYSATGLVARIDELKNLLKNGN